VAPACSILSLFIRHLSSDIFGGGQVARPSDALNPTCCVKALAGNRDPATSGLWGSRW